MSLTDHLENNNLSIILRTVSTLHVDGIFDVKITNNDENGARGQKPYTCQQNAHYF